jgi:hypothetical protein
MIDAACAAHTRLLVSCGFKISKKFFVNRRRAGSRKRCLTSIADCLTSGFIRLNCVTFTISLFPIESNQKNNTKMSWDLKVCSGGWEKLEKLVRVGEDFNGFWIFEFEFWFDSYKWWLKTLLDWSVLVRFRASFYGLSLQLAAVCQTFSFSPTFSYLKLNPPAHKSPHLQLQIPPETKFLRRSCVLESQFSQKHRKKL